MNTNEIYIFKKSGAAVTIVGYTLPRKQVKSALYVVRVVGTGKEMVVPMDALILKSKWDKENE